MQINFLKDRQQKIKQQKKLDRQILNYSIGAFSICMAIFISVMSYRIYLNFHLDKIQKNQEAAKDVITQHEDTEKTYRIMANKINMAKGIFNERSNKQEAINFFTSLLAETTYNEEISYLNKKLTLILQTKNVFDLEKTIDLVSSEEITKQYPSIKRQTISRNNDGTYNLELIIDLSKKT